MKKLTIFASAILLLLACQKAENILQIVPGAPDNIGAGNLPTVTSITPGVGQELIDQNSSQSGIQGKIEIVFSNFMDPSTMTESYFIILNTATGSAIPSSGITTEYYQEIKKLFIFIDDAPSAGAYLLTLSGMTNTYGVPLDFDGDNEEDGAPYDDYLSTFWTTGYTDTLVVRTWPQITAFAPDTIATPNQQPLIILLFNANMDTSTVNTTNITLENSSGSAQTLNVVLKTLTTITLQPASNLALGDNYTINVNCANIKRTGDSRTPGYLLNLDGNEDGPESTEPELQSYFRVDTVVPPHVDAADITGGARFIFTRLIDESTLSGSSVIVFDDIGYVPGDLRIYTNTGNTYTIVDYYYKRATSGNPDALVSRSVKDASKNYFLDGDGNGIGGEAWDDYWEYNF
ncbi:hypothetical protein A2Y85_08290 [candidate division WOR-3 bacterium RBG_13_43_14]|uniref:SbsA Ig-like domain-containing protein n=1 Tax=candidate division WOR-3 bacterium RBG_13_43_14 TaxID=1802590 RepID=A0A1F4U3H6_UNCW3|nr:MAG: hypothetical protein A2Y85_08290 [candidate division WOR-3 bacterium RBG_13_43_14]